MLKKILTKKKSGILKSKINFYYSTWWVDIVTNETTYHNSETLQVSQSNLILDFKIPEFFFFLINNFLYILIHELFVFAVFYFIFMIIIFSTIISIISKVCLNIFVEVFHFWEFINIVLNLHYFF